MRNRIQYIGFFLILLVGLVPRVEMIAGGREALVQLMPDDAFYYFQVARNVAAAKGSTFDGIYPTNGYHPLWLNLLLPIAATVHDATLLIQIGLAVSIALNVACAWLLYRLLLKITYSLWLSLTGTALYFCNPQTLLSSVNGLETTISSLLFVCALYPLLLPTPVRDQSIGKILNLGLTLGLLFLARTDNIFYVAVIFLIFLFQVPRHLRLLRGIRLVCGIGVVTVPWLLWDWLKFGELIQSSGLAVPYVLHEIYMSSGHTFGEMIGWSATQLLLYTTWLISDDVGFPPVFFQATILYCLFILWKRRQNRMLNGETWHRFLTSLALLWAAGFILIFVHAFVRWYPRPWYFNQLIILFVITACVTLTVMEIPDKFKSIAQHSGNGGGGRPRLIAKEYGIAVFVFVLLLLASAETESLFSRPYANQIEMLDAADWLQSHLKENETAAAFNSGIIGYFSGRHVINLDGTIDNAAYVAITRKALLQFMRAAAINYYLDYSPTMWNMYSPVFGEVNADFKMTAIQKIDRTGSELGGSPIIVYRLEWLR